jgi:hypothetical protein
MAGTFRFAAQNGNKTLQYKNLDPVFTGQTSGGILT